MTNNRILLSICIPTYNRASTLEQTLRNITENPEIDDRVEIIVSDNASTDHTRQVVTQFPKVKYYCNDENIKDLNFSKVLSYASGEYIKLTNDTTFYKPQAITTILGLIEKHKETKPILYFCQNAFNYRNCEKWCESLDQFLNILSVNITWTNIFGIWREQFIELEDKNRMAALQFAQVDWNLRNFEHIGKGVIYFSDFLGFTPLTKKGGYNVIRVFVENYLSILYPYVESGKISVSAFELEKKRLYQVNIQQWLPNLYVNKKVQFDFDMSGVWSLLLHTYGKKKYFWISLPEIFFYIIFIKFKNLVRPIIKKL